MILQKEQVLALYRVAQCTPLMRLVAIKIYVAHIVLLCSPISVRHVETCVTCWHFL